jgi:hypothetical protein
VTYIYTELLQILKKNGYGGKLDSKQWLAQVGGRQYI